MSAKHLPNLALLDALNGRRHWLSALGTAAVGLAIILAGRPTFTKPSPLPAQRAMELVLETIAPEPLPTPPVPPVPPVVVPPEPQIQPPKPLERLQPSPPKPTQPSTPAVTPQIDNTAGKDAPTTAPVEPARSAALAPSPSPSPAPPAPQPTPAPAPPPAPVSANPEAPFIGQLRAMLNSSKRYPTGREASLQRPAGKVVVWFVLARSGALKDSGIEDSSNSILIDNAALSTIRRATFPAFPEAAWAGSDTHRFTVSMDFVPPA